MESKIAFVFSGHGAQWNAMGANLLEEKCFRNKLEECDLLFQNYTNRSIVKDIENGVADLPVDAPWTSFYNTFSIQVSIAETLINWGIKPDAIASHSLGEFAAACTAKVINLEDAIKIVWEYCLITRAIYGKGKMIFAAISEKEAKKLLENNKDVVIAAVNSPESVILSAERNADKLTNIFNSKGIFNRILKVDAAFHCPQLNPYLSDLEKNFYDIKNYSYSIPIYSSIKGRLMTENDFDAKYWASIIREPVQFDKMIPNMFQDDIRIFIEISPHPVLCSAINDCLNIYKDKSFKTVGTLERGYDDKLKMIETLAFLSNNGVKPDISKLSIDNQETLTKAIKKEKDEKEALSDVQINLQNTTSELIKLIALLVKMQEEEIKPDVDIIEYGFDSLAGLKLIHKIKDIFGISISFANIFKHKSAQGIAEYIYGLASDKLDTSFKGIMPHLPEKIDIEKGIYNTSEGQKGLWFLYRLNPEDYRYNVPLVFKLSSDIKINVLKKSFNTLIKRHPVLSVSIREKDGEPYVYLNDDYKLNFQTEDINTLDESEIREFLKSKAKETFDLEKEPVMKVSMFSSKDGYILFVNIHHIVFDGTSMTVLINDLSQIYDAYLKNTDPILPKLKASYFDFVKWQDTMLQSIEYTSHEQFWLKKLLPLPDVLRLPAQNIASITDKSQKGLYQIEIPKDLWDSVKKFSDKKRVSYFSFLLSVYNILLYRYSQQEDITVKLPAAARPHANFDNLIGYFVNMIVIRSDVKGDLSFETLLYNIQKEILESLEHQDYPFTEMVKKTKKIGEESPLANVSFAFQRWLKDINFGFLKSGDNSQGDSQGLAIEYLLDIDYTGESEIFLELFEIEDRLVLAFKYNAAKFDNKTIEQMARHFENIINAALDNPVINISDIPMLSEDEKHKILVEFNNTAADYPKDKCIHELFEQQALNTPDAIAVVFEDRSITYQELNERANRLAHYLKSLGVGLESLVGICMERSIEMIIGLLGILKAGGAYLPLDPDYPKDRLMFMLQDSNVIAAVVHGKTSQIIEGSSLFTVCMDKDLQKINSQSQENLKTDTKPENLAYVIYTSGSTGRPKGVEIAHLSIAALLYGFEQKAHISKNFNGTSLCSFNFDVSVWEFFSSLCFGGTLHILKKDIQIEPNMLADYILDKNIDSAYIPPSLLEHTVKNLAKSKKKLKLRRLLVGVESIKQYILQKFIDLSNNMKIINGYGPTECTVCSTFFDFKTAYAPQFNTPIGKPVNGYNTYILDKNLNPVPIGVPGELHISGVGLARGYLNRPELTKEKFIKNPFSINSQNKIMYKTGDLCRWLPDGNIEFLGRIDDQVKIRGFRIELSEIESVLSKYPKVKESAAVVRQTENDDKQIVAYVVPKIEEADTLKEESAKEHISLWEELYDKTYGQTDEVKDPAFNITGWNSSYTSKPIPEDQMLEWRDSTVNRILSFKPESVIEIGCGTGLLLSAIAPSCKNYVGTDFSKQALEYIEKLKLKMPKLSNVQLMHRGADNFEGIEPQSFDTVILNSIIQYFSSADYLIKVIEGAVKITKPGGRIFIGDIRDFNLIETFHSSVELYKAAPSLSIEKLINSIRINMEGEGELLVDPQMFFALKQKYPEITDAKVLLKRGNAINELTMFRYDAVLFVKGEKVSVTEPILHDWKKDKIELSDIKKLLSEQKSNAVYLKGVLNRRIQKEDEAKSLLFESLELNSAAEIKESVADIDDMGINPEDLYSLAESMQFTAQISPDSSSLFFDAVFIPKDLSENNLKVTTQIEENTKIKPWAAFTNNPLAKSIIQESRKIEPELRNFLGTMLPDYMIPAFFVFMDKLPLTPNGKIDRKNLPAPDFSEIENNYIAPRDPFEEIIASVWAAVLGLEKVGIYNNFFELGGHSLLATQVISRLRDSIETDIPVKTIFDSPTVAELSLAVKMQGRKEFKMPAITPTDKTKPLPLSFAQQRLWFLYKLEGKTATYNIPFAYRIKGKLNIEATQKAFKEILNRHESLRTVFREQTQLDKDLKGKSENYETAQVILPETDFNLSIVDLQKMPENEREAEVRSLVSQEAKIPFDLENGPIFKSTLYRLSNTDYVLLINIHHIASDGWSMGVFTREFNTLYNDFANNRAASLPDLEIQYSDFAVWQRSWLTGDVLQKQLSFWENRLNASPVLINLPTDRHRPPVQTFNGKFEYFKLDKELSSKLKRLTAKNGATLFMTLFSAFNALLTRYGAGEDIVIGTPIANRNHSQTEPLIGFFVNTLALRTDLSGDPAFEDLLDLVKRNALLAYQNQDLPFEKLVDEIKVERSLSHSPIFQVMFALQNAPLEDIEISDLKFSYFDLDYNISKFDISLYTQEKQGEIEGIFEYNIDLFDSVTIKRMIKHFKLMLNAISDNPKQNISDIPMLSEDEKHQILVDFNDTAADYPKDKCIHELFEQQALNTPDAIAVVFEDKSITYKKLNEKANQLAHYLKSLGVGPESLVGICMERSIEMIIGLLGILKAGGAYLPLDPDYPKDRLMFMLQDSNVKAAVVHGKTSQIIEDSRLFTVCMDKDLQKIDSQSQENLKTDTKPENLAYVIYTSGSTGRPKGVEITHKSLANLCFWHNKEFEITPSDKAAQTASFGFDASVWELWPYLTSGASVYPVKQDIILSPQNLTNWLLSNEITITFLPTPLAETVLPLTWSKDTKLRIMLTGGDRLSKSYQPPFKLINNYGPTENTVVTTSGPVLEIGNQSLPSIGRPIYNTKVYIIDKNLNPVPVGVPGELHISGVGLARGYLNRPELTKEKFIKNPFLIQEQSSKGTEAQSERMYKTGDLCRWLPDGNIEFLGRIDNQVKIRGFRIELAEIEALLSKYPKVKECAAVVRQTENKDKQIVAYIVKEGVKWEELSAKEQEELSIDLKQYLKKSLPDYMIPAFFVFMDKLPLTPNGKIDRKLLPALDPSLLSDSQYIEPKTEKEKILAKIWQQVLGVEKAGLKDNFFNMGGDSIMSIKVVSLAAQEGLTITVKDIFESQSLMSLAQIAKAAIKEEADYFEVTGPVTLTPIIKWFFDKQKTDSYHLNQSFLLKTASKLKPETVKKGIDSLIRHHDALRLSFKKTKFGIKCVNERLNRDISYFKSIDLSQIDPQKQPEEIERHCQKAQESFVLEKGLLIKAIFFNMGEKRQNRLFIVIHHLAVDGVSWRILLEDMEIACRQIENGEEIILPSKTTSFKDWSFRLASYAGMEELIEEGAWWTDKLKDAFYPAIFKKESSNTYKSAKNIRVSLSIDDTSLLLKDAHKAYNTRINDLLISALALTISKKSGSQKVIFDIEGHGREDLFDDIDLSRTVGWFTSLFPIPLKVERFKLDALIKSIKEQLRALPKNGIGYGVLRYMTSLDSGIRKTLESLPIPEISFNYLGQFDQSFQRSEIFEPAAEPAGSNIGLSIQRDHIIDINGITINNIMSFDLTYSGNIEDETAEAFAQDFIDNLKYIISHCIKPKSFGKTPSDFPLVKLDQLSIDKLTENKNIEDIYPLTPMQEGLIFHTLYEPESDMYFEQIYIELEGEINTKAFNAAWQKLIDRHPALRTGFVYQATTHPVQIVHKKAPLPFKEIDLIDIHPDEQETRFQKILEDDRKQGFVFETPPVMRCILVKVAPNLNKFVLSFHHSLMDGWCLPILLSQVDKDYQALCKGKEADIPQPAPYSDYIKWLMKQNKETALNFWKKELEGFTEPNNIMLGKNTGQSSVHSQILFSLSKETTDKAIIFARTNGITSNIILQAAWALLINRYSGGNNDIVFGTVFSGRPPELEGVESMVGLFINTLPVRVKLENKTNVLTLLKDLHKKHVRCQEFSYVGLTDIQKVSSVDSGIQMFETMIGFENYPRDSSLFKSESTLNINKIKAFEHINYPLTLMAMPGEKLEFILYYDRIRFEKDAMVHLLNHLKNIINSIIEQPLCLLKDLPMLLEDEKHKILAEFNNTAADYPKDKCIHELFEQQALNTPDAMAVVFEDRSITYQELNEKANQLAHYFQSVGVGTESIVGICMERSIEMIIGLLGIIKAGGAYLPLDPDYPKDRLYYMADDSKISLLITNSGSAESIPMYKGKIIFIDKDWNKICKERKNDPKIAVTSDNPAYVLYTSGSSGQPKGVIGIHKGMVNRLNWMWKKYPFESNEICCQKTSLNFVDSLWEIFGPILKGVPVVIIPNNIVKDTNAFINTLAVKKITRLVTVPSLLQVILDIYKTGRYDLANLKYCVTSGEALPSALSKNFHELMPDTVLLNLYGSSECSADSSFFQTKADSSLKNVPIGTPIANTKIYILDKDLKPVPLGVPGEIHISGVGLAKGYLNRPELTKEKFIKNPFLIPTQRHKDAKAQSAKKEIRDFERMYKTGDLGRWLKDDNIEYMGRIDNQVKIRGIRVELSEIEAVLSKYPKVKECAAVVRQTENKDKQIVAYIVKEGVRWEELSAKEQEELSIVLKQFLKKSLPDYMIPAFFIFMDKLPLTPNGKIDRKNLPTLEKREIQKDAMPKTEAQEIIKSIWQEVIGIDNVGIYENFFEVGGHSLLSVRVQLKLQEKFKKDIYVTDIFQYPTIESMAKYIAHDIDIDEEKDTPRIKPVIAAKDKDQDTRLAVIGMGFRLPGADTQKELWNNLKNGVESISSLSDEELMRSGVPEKLIKDPNYVRARAIIEDIDKFDAMFFNFTPSEAEITDPQHRIFLQCAYESLENAGCLTDKDRYRIGVYAGCGENTYFLNNIHNNPYAAKYMNQFQIMIGNGKDYLATHTAYKLNLKGPALTVQTACSTSLVAVHLACSDLTEHRCDIALAGGVSLTTPQKAGYIYDKGMIMSPDGRCRAFDAGANGTAIGSGCAIVVLKRLKDAIADKDNIFAVIRGTAINNDGSLKVGYTAPSIEGQADVIAMAQAGIDPETITYIEAHGTGTSLGDPIEIAALTKAFNTQKRNFCAIGSIKTNIGHLDAAAGAAGLIKAILSVKNGFIPPSLNFKTPNPKINFKNSPFYVADKLIKWEASPRRAGVSSFGIGGTNAHVIVEQWDGSSQNNETGQNLDQQVTLSTLAPNTSIKTFIFVLSAKNEDRLKAYVKKMIDFLDSDYFLSLKDPDDLLASMAYTLQVSRQAMEYRLAIIAKTREELVSKLKDYYEGKESQELYTDIVELGKSKIAVLIEDETGKAFLKAIIKNRELDKLASLWTNGVYIDWNTLYDDEKPQKISLPTYPFAKERYWIEKVEQLFSESVEPEEQKGSDQNLTLNTLTPNTLDFNTYLIEKISAITKLDPERLNPDKPFEEYGLDSIMIVNLNKELEKDFGKLPSTLFFTYKNIRTLAKYLEENHGDRLKAYKQTAESAPQKTEQQELKKITITEDKIKVNNQLDKAGSKDIAIIGISGRYPMAENLNQFWENLKAGKDCIQEIPKDRWDCSDYPDIYCKWGGFLKDIDKFDPLFFNISPKDAKFMDPQERLFLEASWQCLEDAGYPPKRIKDPRAGDNRADIGVFAGVTYNEYQLYSAIKLAKGAFVPCNTQIFSVANRVSYCLNLSGPSLSVDTACSSSLYAIHLACESIIRKECSMALAGGVNLSLHPNKYIGLCLATGGAKDGRCRAFCEGGTGYVPSEGVGSVLLKPLEKAAADNDRIYAVIKGTAANHDGRTQGYNVPNPVAQTEVIKKVIEKSGINPKTISYVEAHGTGTSLGDPIEITGLTDAYSAYTGDKQYCPIGSVKSNIGHCEAAAGIAQVTKTLLQMKYKTLVPSVMHSKNLNPNIDFENSPFFLQTKLLRWDKPAIDGETYPRRAGMSSFGAGGVNVHLIMEEYEKNEQDGNRNKLRDKAEETKQVIIPISAKTEESLRGYAADLKTFLEDTKNSLSIEEIAYTLQIGRESMAKRVIFEVKTVYQLIEKLDKYIKNEFEGDDHIWLKDPNFDWGSLYPEEKPGIVSLPTYHFAKERYWIAEPSKKETNVCKQINFEKQETVIKPAKQKSEDSNLKSESVILSETAFLTELLDSPEFERKEIIEKTLQEILAKILEFESPKLPVLSEGFFDMGMNSVDALNFQRKIEKKVGIKISDTAAFDYSNIIELSQYLISIIPFDELEKGADSLLEDKADDKPDNQGDINGSYEEKVESLFISAQLPEDIEKMSIEEVLRILESETIN